MISVEVLINGRMIERVTAVRVQDSVGEMEAVYKTGKGKFIHHHPSKSAMVLAKKMLETIGR